MFKIMQIMAFSCLVLALAPAAPAAEVTRQQIKGLDEQVQDIKKDVLELTSELNRLEEKLLFPSNTQVSLFVSLNEGSKVRLDSIQLMLDNVVVAQHLYNFRELEALKKGGVQKVYTGNIKTGEHNLVVSVKGKAGDDFTETGTYTINKAVGPRFVEIKLDRPGSSESISFQDW